MQAKIVGHSLKKIGEEGDAVLVLTLETYGTQATTYKSRVAVPRKDITKWPLGGVLRLDMELTQQELQIEPRAPRAAKNGAQTEMSGASSH